MLRLTQWHDLEVVGVDPEPITGIIRVVDAAGTTELAELARVTGSSIGWGVGVYELPADVLGQSVRFEFELVSDAAAVTDFAGWYLQRVEVEVLPTAP